MANKCEVCGSKAVDIHPLYMYNVCKEHSQWEGLKIHEAVLAVNGVGGLSADKFFVTWKDRL